MTLNTAKPMGQPTLQELMSQFLATRSDAMTAVESGEPEVEPHEVAGGFRVDPRAAWNDAVTAHTAGRQAPGAPAVPLPPDWATVVNQPAPAFAVPMAAGNFPQRVRDLQPLLNDFKPEQLRPAGEQPALPGLGGLRGWIAKNAVTQPVLAAGVARLIGDFDQAERLLPAEEANERAALLWQRGRFEEALGVWVNLPETGCTLFNRGMALLFLGKITEAKVALEKAIAMLPEDGSWSSLARLYLAVAEIQG